MARMVTRTIPRAAFQLHLGYMICAVFTIQSILAEPNCNLDCLHGGSCRVLADGISDCVCLAEYYGDRCQTQNPCLKNDFCGDHGTCTDMLGGAWKCTCTPGYSGYRCQDLDPCSANPCSPAQICRNVDDSYQCECSQEGYYGSHCERYDGCVSSPCLHGGECKHDGNTSYRCDCDPAGNVTGYYGQHCEYYDPCLLEPCNVSGGLCRNMSSAEYVCDCYPGFYGNFCSNYDACLTSPCLNNGTCTSPDDGQTYTCSCPAKYVGSRCEKKLQCTGDATVDIKGIIDWPDVDIETETANPCPFGGKTNVTRRCRYEQATMSAKWEFPDTSGCERANLTNELAATMTSYLRDSTGSNPSDMGDTEVSSASELLDAVVDFSYEQQEMASNMMGCVSNLLEVGGEVMRTSADSTGADTRLLNMLSSYASKVVMNDESEDLTFDTPNLQYQIHQVRPGAVQELALASYTTSFVNDTDQGISISLPNILISDMNVASTEPIRVRFTALKNSKLFIAQDRVQVTSNDMENQYVISAEVTGLHVNDLSQPVVYNVPTPQDGRNYSCAYWSTSDVHHWARDGLSAISSDGNMTSCTSNHLTYFAVILDTGYSEPIPDEHILALEIISYLGTACSVFGLVTTIITYSIFKALRRTSSGRILIHLSVSLLALNITFLLDTSPTVNDSVIGCKITAMLLQYFVLSTFLWMGMEAVNMYRTLIVVFQRRVATHFVLKGALIAWGLPAVPVVVTAIVNIDLYGKLPQNEICMLTQRNPYAYYAGYLGPCCALLMANFVVFFMILRTVCATKKDLHARNKRVRRTQIGCALSITCLLGITWVLGFFAVEGSTLVFTYLVCIINPMQGFFIFLFRCALYPEALRSWTVCCTTCSLHEDPRNRSSQGKRTPSSSGAKGKKQKESERLISGDSHSGSKRNSQDIGIRKTTSTSSMTFTSVHKCDHVINGSGKRTIPDVKLDAIQIKEGGGDSRNC